MAVYIDKANIRFRRMVMCHMIADSLDELHAIARRIGMRREWFQCKASFPHYDVCLTRKQKALALGVKELDRWQFVAVLRRIRRTMKGGVTTECGNTLSRHQ